MNQQASAAGGVAEADHLSYLRRTRPGSPRLRRRHGTALVPSAPCARNGLSAAHGGGLRRQLACKRWRRSVGSQATFHASWCGLGKRAGCLDFGVLARRASSGILRGAIARRRSLARRLPRNDSSRHLRRVSIAPRVSNLWRRTRRGFERLSVVARAALGLMGAVLTVAGVWALIDSEPETRYTNLEIVLDRSARMREPFEGDRSRLDVAVSALEEVVGGKDGDNLGLRTVGGDCESDGDLTVDIGTGHAKDIVSTGESAKPAGEAPLAGAIVAAAGDFGSLERFPAAVDRRIVVISGGGDSCSRNAAERVRERLKEGGRNLALEFRLVGVGVPQEERASYEALAEELPDAEVQFADDERSLRDSLDEFIERQPVLKGAQAVLALGEEAIDHLRDFDARVYEAFNSRVPGALIGADDALDKADSVLDESELPFLALEDRADDARLGSLHAKVAELRGTDRQIIGRGRSFLDRVRRYVDREPAAEARARRARDAYEQLKTRHNSVVAAIDSELVKLGIAN